MKQQLVVQQVNNLEVQLLVHLRNRKNLWGVRKARFFDYFYKTEFSKFMSVWII
jgi:hypothetical protein